MADIDPKILIPDLIRQYPAARRVLDRYGLKGCGGVEGPREPLLFFARIHGVEWKQLKLELDAAIAGKDNNAPVFRPSIADTIYRPFFLAGLATILTAGCVWGAINLLLIGMSHTFTAIDYSWVLAHGHAMVFGFVGFFIMGFAYQAIPRFKHIELPHAAWALASLPVMAGGIILQIIAHLWEPRPGYLALGIVSGAIQISAVLIFGWIMLRTLGIAQKPERYDRFLKAALAWFTVAAVLNPVIFWLFESATREQFLFRVSVFNIPYRDIQLFGIAVLMILGVSLRYLPHAYGFRQPSDRWAGFMFWGVNGTLIVSIVSFLGMMTLKQYWLAIPLETASIVLLAVALGMPRQFRLFAPVPPEERDRGLKFIRAAYVWFIAAMVLLVAAPVYNLLIFPLAGGSVPFSHAYFGAYRHSITVGFIMLMIVGVSSKVVPTLAGVDVRRLPNLWSVFLLLNIGNIMRVSTQIATDFTPLGFSMVGFSGFIEVTGLLIWGWDMVRVMHRGKQLARQEVPAVMERQPVREDMRVFEVLQQYPQSLHVFLRHGFTPLKNPVARNTMARVITVAGACRRENIPLDALMRDLHLVCQPQDKS